MTVWICSTCMIEHPDTQAPPAQCTICSDERQWVPAGGQQWTSQSELEASGHVIEISELQPGLHSVECVPRVGIGQRGLLAQTTTGNLFWEPPGLITADAVDRVRELGGVAAVTASHPHLVGAAVSWAKEFDAPFYVAADDAEWVLRPHEVVRFWQGSESILPGVTLHQCGGHFDGSSVALWQPDAVTPGVLLTGDTIMIGGDRKSVSAMRSYVNDIPLGASAIACIMETVESLDYDRMYSAFKVIESGGKGIVAASFERYLGWIRS